MTVGKYVYDLIHQSYRQIVKPEKAVLAGREPESLHEMRVGARRLRTALRVFDQALDMPKAANADCVADLCRGLGELRDLDVQMAVLQTRYRPHLDEAEQQILSRVLAVLAERRQVAFEKATEMLTRSRSPYKAMKSACKKWLAEPQFDGLAAHALVSVLPNLVSPWLSKLLLHPGWWVATVDITPSHNLVLHNLRKTCKTLRYQLEFFQPFYGAKAQLWLRELKSVQGILGAVQDGDVLLDLLSDVLPKRAEYPGLKALITTEREEAMADWDTLRQKYLDPGFQRGLYHMLLEPRSLEQDRG